jgi:hypothetical protein
MARPIVADRVVETTNTTGTGTIDLNGAQTGYRAFLDTDEISSGTEAFYVIADSATAPTEYEVGIGTVTAANPNTLSRDTVLESSNGGSKISLQGGTTYIVTCTLPSRLPNTVVDVLDTDADFGGSAAAMTLTTYRKVAAYEGQIIAGTATATNAAGGVTLDKDSEGAADVKLQDGSDPYAGAIVDGGFYLFRYNASNQWVLINPEPRHPQQDAQTSLSGFASVEWTDIPAWATRITIGVDGMSSNSTGIPAIQLGDNGGYEATGYTGAVLSAGGGGNAASNLATSVIVATSHTAAATYHGQLVFTRMDESNNVWTFAGVFAESQAAEVNTVAGAKSLSATLDKLRLLVGAGQFDAGTANILVE